MPAPELVIIMLRKKERKYAIKIKCNLNAKTNS
jgi:hypothetical protein